ncbi:adherens junction formation factor afadin [Dermacentor variabilis]|uniref:adherens junction formation factor afadin n=1 Tax=Dermacentor variabilis TaxID=34621 RepID=UPI003F5B8ED9
MASERELKAVERINLRNTINQWNANRLDLFELSEPNEDLEFHGVMRFYFQDADQKVVTKCIRVSSTATVNDVVGTLIEKFRPDIRMLSVPDYALYEIHENGEERKLGPDERPLLVQLNWHQDDREGRFLFRRMDHKSRLPTLKVESLRFGRKLSRREHKKKKNKEPAQTEEKDGIAEKLYTELPETSFTRSISNPEAVMRRRRQQKLERKLQQFRQEGSPEAGGTLRIFGESLNRDVPYKTLLLSTTDTAAHVVREILVKYGLEQEEPQHYCLVQVLVPPPPGGLPSPQDPPTGGLKEFILDDDDCPLAIERQHNRMKGTLSFHIRRRPADYQPRKRKKKAPSGGGTVLPEEGLPFLQEVPQGGGPPGPCHPIPLHMTEVGSAPSGSQGLQLQGPGVLPRHCVIAHTEGVVTVTPSQPEAETYVDGARVFDTTLLQHGATVRFGRSHLFRFWQAPPPRAAALPPASPAAVGDNHRPPHEEDHRLRAPEPEPTSMVAVPDHMGPVGAGDHRDQRRGDPILPAVLELWEEHESLFLDAVINQLDWLSVQFKLVPAYTLYMACRYRASTHFRPETSPTERAQRLTALATNIGARVRVAVEQQQRDSGPLAFWLANASELLHFLRQDRHLSAYTLDAQDLLTEALQLAFRQLVAAQRRELAQALPRAFLSPDTATDAPIGEALGVLASSMSLLRRCRVNAALTIQLFSWLFHHVNAWLLNSLLLHGRPPLCRPTGALLKRRLAHLVAWAEQQGLELAADCHLARLIQAAHLLAAPKAHPQHDLPLLADACFKLNSVQVRHLLERFQPLGPGDQVGPGLIEALVREAHKGEDARLTQEGRPLQLAEEPQLALPFLLPEDGYSCETVRGVPPGLQEFLQPLCLAGLCRLTLQPTSLGHWTIYMCDQDVLGPRILTLTLKKSPSGMGLSIVAARGSNQDRLGIYVKSVVRGGAADLDGRLQAGDQLLRVDGHSLVGVSQEKAAELMTRTGPLVQLEVAKQGAIHHGLASLLCQPSPLLLQRGSSRLSERDIPGRLAHEEPPPRIQGSKSVPALNCGSAAMDGGSSQHLAPGSSMTMPPRGYPPGPSYSPRQAAMEERQYQNIGLYQQQHQQQQQLPQQPHPPIARPSHGSQPLPWSPPTSSSSGNAPLRPEVGARPLSTLVSPREQEQYVSSLGSLAMGHHSGPPGGGEKVLGAPLASDPPPHWSPHPPPPDLRAQRDLLRQEAKMEEMKEEVRRREERDLHQPLITKPPMKQHPQQGVRSPPPPETSNGHHPNNRIPRDAIQVASPSPWEREEKEMRRLQRLEEMRQMRDEELQELESLPNRTSRQEERLKALRLEREFERRAQELAGDEDEEEQDLTTEVQHLKERPSQHPWEPIHVVTPRHLEEQEDRLRQLRLEESGKQQELAAQRMAEEQLLREAQRRQQQQQQQQQQYQNQQQQHHHQLQQQQQQQLQQQQLQQQQQQLQQQLQQQQQRQQQEEHQPHDDQPPPLPACPPPPPDRRPPPSKKVSFTEAPPVEVCPQDDEEEDSGYTLQDIDAVLNAPPGGYLVASTPGVIGAQEVYRDPRQRIERQRALQQPSKPPGPEKLTFREKMRMFARETGEEHTPRDKMKISRAQREIETSLNGVPAPNR